MMMIRGVKYEAIRVAAISKFQPAWKVLGRRHLIWAWVRSWTLSWNPRPLLMCFLCWVKAITRQEQGNSCATMEGYWGTKVGELICYRLRSHTLLSSLALSPDLSWSNHKNVHYIHTHTWLWIASRAALHLQFGQLDKSHAHVMINESAKKKSYPA